MLNLYRLKIFAVFAAASLVAGCAGIPTDRGFADSKALVVSRGGPQVAAPLSDEEAQRQTAEWITTPLTVESAQRIALTRNPQLLQQYARLGIAQAEVYDAARISNPLFSFAWLDGSAGGAQVALGLAQNFADILYLSPRKRRASGELVRTQQQVAGELVKLAAVVEAGYYAYVGAVAVVELRNAVAGAASASADLAQRFFDAGNINRLQLNREKAAATEARIESDRAATNALAVRSALNTLLGLTAENDRWTIQTRLSPPMNHEDEPAELQRLAQLGRLDLLSARQSVVLLEDALGVTRSYRFIGDIQLGVDYEHETDRSRLLGPTLGLTLPVFNWGNGRVERARAELDQARAEARTLEIGVSNEVRLAHARVQGARDLVERYRMQLIPQREEVVRRAAEMQNYMIIGQFELLQDKRQEYDAYQGYLVSLADYWTARADLAQAIGARLPSSVQITSEGIEPNALIAPKQSEGSHEAHGRHGAEGGSSDMDMKGMDMKGIPGTAPPVQEMETMPKSDAVAPSTEPSADHEKKQIDNVGSAAKQVACDRLKSADMNDPLMQALAQKCREQPQSANPNGEEHTNYRSSTSNSIAPDASSADGVEQPSSSEHTH